MKRRGLLGAVAALLAVPLASLAEWKRPSLQDLVDCGKSIPPGDYTLHKTLVIRGRGMHITDVIFRAGPELDGPLVRFENAQDISIVNSTFVANSHGCIRIGGPAQLVGDGVYMFGVAKV